MQLKDWLTEEGQTLAEFGERIGRTAEAVRRYANGDRIPDRETMPKIAEVTKGRVTANDFFRIDEVDHGAKYGSSREGASPGTFAPASHRPARVA